MSKPWTNFEQKIINIPDTITRMNSSKTNLHQSKRIKEKKSHTRILEEHDSYEIKKPIKRAFDTKYNWLS